MLTASGQRLKSVIKARDAELRIPHNNGRVGIVDQVFQISIAFAQRQVHLFALGNILHKKHKLRTVEGQVIDADCDIIQIAILAAVPGLESVMTLSYDMAHVDGNFFGRFNGFQVGNVHGQQFLLTITAHPAIGLVDFQQEPMSVKPPKAVRSRMDNAPIQFLVLSRQLLRLFEPGNVAQHNAEHAGVAVVLRDRQMYPNWRVIVPHHPQFARP